VGAHCRNRGLALILALLIGGAGLTASYGWGFRRALSAVAAQYPDTTVLQLAQEISVVTWLEARIESGWTLRSSDVSGGLVLFIWAIEALVVLGFALSMGVSAAANPYCERCQLWTESQGTGIRGLTREDAQPLLDRGDLATMLALPERTDTEAAVRIQLLRNYCPQCPDTAYLTVNEVRTEVSNGKAKENKKELLSKAELTPKLSALYLQRLNASREEATLEASAAS
jgi:hypothetical protein